MAQDNTAGETGGSALRSFWRRLTGRAAASDTRELGARELKRLRDTLNECVLGKGGEVSARARTVSLAQTYRELNAAGRLALLELLVEEFGSEGSRVRDAIHAYQNAPGVAERRRAELALRAAATSPRSRILTQLGSMPDGVKFLVDLRADLGGLLPKHPSLDVLDQELLSLFSSWFDWGFLELARITWNSPAALLEKLIAYEAVHEIRSWSDLRNRLDSDRRCYAFFHPRMPQEPLVFVEVALTKAMAANVQELLDEAQPVFDASLATHAVFYSISNTQPGLRGVSFGGFLIKRVLDALRSEFPQVKTFVTLSPMPGFRKWLDKAVDGGAPDLFARRDAEVLRGLGHGDEPGKALCKALDAEGWHQDAKLAATLEPVLLRAGARYLLGHERDGGRVSDAVARFHLGNGARLERLNFLADTSRRGLRQSAGLMVNYLYRPEDLEANHEAFFGDGVVVASNAVRRWFK